MFEKFISFSYRHYRRILYGIITFVLILGINLSSVRTSYAFSWLELMIQGIQVVQLSNISNAQELELGKGINQQIISSGRARISTNASINSYIDRIGQRLAQTSDRSDLPYTFQVVDDDSINAFATMGGFVYINKGLIEAADNEAELASVIGHEIGHIVGRHSIEQMRNRALSQGLLSAAGLDRNDAIQIGVELAVNRPNGRSDELEADRFGLENMIRADYAPAGILGFMEKLLQKGGSPPSVLSTHPATSERIRILEELIDPKTMNVGNGLNNEAYESEIRSL